MAESVGTIYYEVEAETSKLVNGGKYANKSLDELERRFKNTDKTAGGFNTKMRETAAAAKKAGDNAKSAAVGFDALYKITAAYLTLGTLKALAGLADQYGQNADRIKNATSSTEEYELVQRRLLETANGTYRALSEAQEVYLAVSGTLKDLGYNTAEVLDISDSLSYAFVRDAARADQAQSAMDAYSKSLMKGKIDAEGWASMMAATPSLVEGIAEATGKTEAEIRKLGATGKLSLEALNEGMLRSLNKNKEMADGMRVSTSDAMQAMRNSLQVFIGKVDEASGSTSTFSDLVGEFASILQDPATVQAAADMATGIMTAINKIIEGAREVVNVTRWMAESVAAAFHGAAADDVVRLQGELENFEKARNRNPVLRLFDGYTDEELDAEIAKRKNQISDYYKWQEDQAKHNAPPAAAPTSNNTRPRVSATDPSSGGKSGKSGANREIEAQARAAASYVQSLKEQADAIEKLTTAEKLVYDIRNKGLVLSEKQLHLAQAYAASIDHRQNVDVIAELALELDKAAMSAEQLAEFNALAKLNPAATPEQVETVRQMARELERMNKAKALGDDAKKYIFGNVDPLSGGAFDNQDARYAAEIQKEEERHTQELIRLREFMELKGLTQEEYYAIYEESAQRHADRMQQIEDARTSLQLKNYSDAFGGMADIMKTAQGEQSGIYRAMFAASKAFAIADAMINAYGAISKAWNSAVFPANMAAVAATTPQVMGVVSAIRGASISGGRQYGGPVGAGGLYRINENGAPEVLNTANGRQYLLPNSRGEVVSNKDATEGGATAAPIVNVNIIENQQKAGKVERSQMDGETIINVFVADLLGDGNSARAIEGKFGLATVGR